MSLCFIRPNIGFVGSNDNGVSLAILMGLPGSGKTSFYRERLAGNHLHISKDLLRGRRDAQGRQMKLIEDALASGRSVAVDNVNATAADRAVLIEMARRRKAFVTGYVLDTGAAASASRNRGRAGRAQVPSVAIFASAKRFQWPTSDEGFDRLYRVTATEGRFEVAEMTGSGGGNGAGNVFLLSPASTSGARAGLLFSDSASFSLAQQIRSADGAPIGEVFSFLSSLYFRGKLAYARAFARPPARLCGAFVITPGEGLRDPAEPITLERLRGYERIPIKFGEARYKEPLIRDAQALSTLSGNSQIVLLGSIASSRYVEPLLEVFGDRLLYPTAFVGRGDMSRGGLLLRCVDDGVELEYAPLIGAVRHGPRPPRLPKRVSRHKDRRQHRAVNR